MTIGQLGPAGSSCGGGNINSDLVQDTVSSGTGYQVPGNGTLTQWSNNAQGAGSGSTLTFKAFHKTGDPNIYKAIGHDGPQPLTPGIINRFPISIPVQAGDLIGINISSPTATNCDFGGADGDVIFAQNPGLSDNQEAQFSSTTLGRLNLSAVFVPSNTVTVGKTTLNTKRGTATLNLTVPNPGDLAGSGNGAIVASTAGARISKSVTPGPAQLLIKAKGKKKRKLLESGKVRLNVAITYTPSGGDPSTQSVIVKLKKKL